MKKIKIARWKIIAIFLMIYDCVAINFSYFFALWIRFDAKFSAIDSQYLQRFSYFMPFSILLCIIIFLLLNMYKSVWRYASIREMIRIGLGVICSILVQIILSFFFGRMPLSYYAIGPVVLFVLLMGIRFSPRIWSAIKFISERTNENDENIMIIGAGSAGQLLLRDIKSKEKNNRKVKCFIDDDSNVRGRYLNGIPIVGGRDDILKSVKQYDIDTIVFAIPSASKDDKREILNICNETNCRLKVLPEGSIFSEKITSRDLKDVSIDDLLGRASINMNLSEVYQQINGKTVLVTGGGGSIGSELCRQIAAHNPKQLVIFDIYENNAYDIQLELREKYPDLNLVVLIGSVRDSRRITEVFETYKPNIVYHAAAHKHVPLMEDSPCEAIKNNTIGTYKTAYAALISNCERFVLISTDKAVNPTNVMGASKRLCEMIIQCFDKMIKDGKANEIPQLFTHEDYQLNKNIEADLINAKTEFTAVRFGNVLGSNGSVIPIFKKQIEKGGPVTVTHPDIVRYFMTIPEAVSLVMLSGSYAKGGEIFVLDMGSPVKIDTLARNMIKVMGYKPDEDIKIVYSGLRPGEKLYEETLMKEEGLKKTNNDLIYVGKPMDINEDVFFKKLNDLLKSAYDNDENIKEIIKETVKTYIPEA